MLKMRTAIFKPLKWQNARTATSNKIPKRNKTPSGKEAIIFKFGIGTFISCYNFANLPRLFAKEKDYIENRMERKSQ